jgi:hypothetical protein
MPDFTFIELWREAERETAMRRAVYEKRIKRGEMSINDAQRQIALMQAIAAHFQPLASAEEAAIAQERERTEPRMF